MGHFSIRDETSARCFLIFYLQLARKKLKQKPLINLKCIPCLQIDLCSALLFAFLYLKDAENEDGVLILIDVINSIKATVLHLCERFRKIAEFVGANIEAIRTSRDR